MPRLRKEIDAQAGYRGLIFEYQYNAELTDGEIADRMGVSRKTYEKYKKTPDAMTIGTARKLHRILGIPAERVRERMAVW